MKQYKTGFYKTTFYKTMRHGDKIQPGEGWGHIFLTSNGEVIELIFNRNTPRGEWSVTERTTGSILPYIFGASREKTKKQITQKIIDNIYFLLQQEYYKQRANELAAYIMGEAKQ